MATWFVGHCSSSGEFDVGKTDGAREMDVDGDDDGVEVTEVVGDEDGVLLMVKVGDEVASFPFKNNKIQNEKES